METDTDISMSNSWQNNHHRASSCFSLDTTKVRHGHPPPPPKKTKKKTPKQSDVKWQAGLRALIVKIEQRTAVRWSPLPIRNSWQRYYNKPQSAVLSHSGLIQWTVHMTRKGISLVSALESSIHVNLPVAAIVYDKATDLWIYRTGQHREESGL